MNQESSLVKILDPSVFESLRGYAKSGAFLKQVIEIFEQHGRVSLGELSAAAQLDDKESLKLIAHRLKGSCLNVGATLMAQNLRHLEQLTTSNETLDETQRLVAGLPAMLEDTCKALKSLL